MAPSAQDDEFVVPPAPAKGNKHMRSRSRGRALSDQQRRKQVTARTSLEDTIENLVEYVSAASIQRLQNILSDLVVTLFAPGL